MSSSESGAVKCENERADRDDQDPQHIDGLERNMSMCANVLRRHIMIQGEVVGDSKKKAPLKVTKEAGLTTWSVCVPFLATISGYPAIGEQSIINLR